MSPMAWNRHTAPDSAHLLWAIRDSSGLAMVRLLSSQEQKLSIRMSGAEGQADVNRGDLYFG